MPLDALCLSGLVHELNGALSGARIDKIYQPGRDEVVLALRAPGGNVKLLLSANPNHPRPQLTQLPRENPDAPPMFCMLLRKHLSGGRILSIAQPHLERVVEIRLEALDELGDRVERRLVLEAMGRHSNLILLDGEGRITDCLRRVDGDMSARRQVLPGLFYRRRAAPGPGGPVAAGCLRRPVPPGLPGAGLPGGRKHRRAAGRHGTGGQAAAVGRAGGTAEGCTGKSLYPRDGHD